MSARQEGLGGILATDQYQLTMAQLYWRETLAERTAQFDYFFRSYPDYGTHQAGYCVAAGLGWLLQWMEETRFEDKDLATLGEQTDRHGKQRFDDGFLAWLSQHGDFSSVEIDAIPEGRVVHANVPIAIIRGPLAMTQILETAFLNHLNYPTLIATKASRVKEAARSGLVLEFGMRRGPGSGAHAGGRAALIGGCDFTSTVALSEVVGFDPKGTHAHSMVQVFMALGEGELEAFRKFARSYPDECVPTWPFSRRNCSTRQDSRMCRSCCHPISMSWRSGRFCLKSMPKRRDTGWTPSVSWGVSPLVSEPG
jgi:nicotinate phosphoribosyltransferase